MVQKVVSEEEKVEKLAELRTLLAASEEETKEEKDTPAKESTSTTSATCDSLPDATEETAKVEDVTYPTPTKPYRGINASLTDADCHRFLRARNYQIQATLEMVLNWYIWFNTILVGCSYTPRDMRRRAVEEGDAQEATYRELLPHSNLGVDKESRPVYWERTGLISSRFGKIRNFLTEDDLFNR